MAQLLDKRITKNVLKDQDWKRWRWGERKKKEEVFFGQFFLWPSKRVLLYWVLQKHLSWLLVCEIPLHSISLANFSCQPCHSYKKLCYKKTIQHCFYHDCNIVKNFQNRNKDTGTSIWNGEIWQTGPTISKFDLFQKSDSVSLLKKADFLEPRIAIKTDETTLAKNGAK